MTIYRAAKKAIRRGMGITRKQFAGSLNLMLTNSSECCLCFHDKRLTPRWQPKADDLTATDWMVVEVPDIFC